MAVTIEELRVAGEPGAWERAGFAVEGDACAVGGVRIRLAGEEAGRGLLGWSLRGAGDTELDGLVTTASGDLSQAGAGDRPRRQAERESPLPAAAPNGEVGREPSHPNGVAGLDHVVAITPALERTVAALQAAGLDLRRVREEPTPAGAPRQAFFRLGASILEVVQEPGDVVARKGAERPAFFWGLAFLAPEIEATAAFLGDRVGEVRDAVQPGRRIATIRREAGLGLPVALITPTPPRAG